MRWQGQKIQNSDEAALLPLKGLVRSVRTPEFEGVTFHEVASRTALNRVPGQSNMPFEWTINPTRGCLHRCVYCLSPDTLILMADGRQKPLREITVGDKIIGTYLEGQYQRFTETEVSAKWGTRKPAYRITLNDGTELTASGDHRFLTERGWKYVAPAPAGITVRPHLTTNSRLMGFGLGSPAAEYRDPVTSLTGQAVKTSSDLKVAFIEDLGRHEEMMDLTTGTGDFIANGVVSHNCFARKTHEYLDLDSGRDFDSQIIVKTNVADVLRAELAKPSWKREHVALGTNSDPYMRAEGRYQLMPGIIEALADSGTPFSILTKGPLLKRDLPLLRHAAEQVPVSVAVSLAMVDPELQQKVEPGTPDPRARLNLIRSIAEAGLDVNVLAMPILPWLSDSPEQLDALHAALAEAGASWVSTGALHLRPGAREWFLQWLAAEYPHLVATYRRIYGSSQGGFSSYAAKDYTHWLGRQSAEARRRHGFIRPADPTWPGRTSPQTPHPSQEPAQPALF